MEQIAVLFFATLGIRCAGDAHSAQRSAGSLRSNGRGYVERTLPPLERGLASCRLRMQKPIKAIIREAAEGAVDTNPPVLARLANLGRQAMTY